MYAQAERVYRRTGSEDAARLSVVVDECRAVLNRATRHQNAAIRLGQEFPGMVNPAIFGAIAERLREEMQVVPLDATWWTPEDPKDRF